MSASVMKKPQPPGGPEPFVSVRASAGRNVESAARGARL